MSPFVRPFRPDDRADVDEIVRAATDFDGVAPLNEASLLALDELSSQRTDSGTAARAWVAGTDASVRAVFVDAEGDGSGCDLVAAPDARREGLGSALLTTAGQVAPTADDARLALWAHGDTEPAQAFAAARGLQAVRDLWRMARPLTSDETFDVALPAGLVARPFDGSDAQAQAWLDVNAAAFASHPEQGRMTMADFRERAEQAWFDPAGLILVWDETNGDLAASHWTKREPGDGVGEVYVVAVAPGYQGRGLAAPLTALGLRHLRDAGARSVELYVEGDNEPAKATYLRRGFERASHDVMYVRSPAPAV